MKVKPAKRRQKSQKSQEASRRPAQGKWHEMSRQERREVARKITSDDISLEVVHGDAAGIDIGNETHYVAVPPIGTPNRCAASAAPRRS